jgi:kinetochore protein Mis13/DSN1
MRQLLVWCATRALGDRRLGSQSDDQSARLAGNFFVGCPGRDNKADMNIARAIQEDLLKDFSSNSDLSNWFSREDTNPPTVVLKKPNPRNVQNTEKIKDLEEQIQKWATLYFVQGNFRANLT